MDRLTIRTDGMAVTDTQNINILVEEQISGAQPWEAERKRTVKWIIGEAIERLAAYEDTGLTPEEITNFFSRADFRTPTMKKNELENTP